MSNVKKSNVGILREVVNRETDGQTIHALEDPCAIYGTTFLRDLFLTLYKSSLCFFTITPFSKKVHPAWKKERALNIYYIIKILQYNHQHMNSITDTHFSYSFFKDLETYQLSFIISIINMKHSHSAQKIQNPSIDNSPSIWPSSIIISFWNLALLAIFFSKSAPIK